jgi:2,3,4,5-tetrahydropyridine-2-carboxylate N-succinyltransferase
MSLQQQIEELYKKDLVSADREHAQRIFSEFLFFLNRGEIRAAENVRGKWKVHTWVKQGILLGFRLGEVQDLSLSASFRFFDKDTYRLKRLSLSDEVRLVPGGSSIRDGAYLARGVVCMPPMYITVGAYVDEDTMIDSHALIGSCAQIGKRVHIGSAAQIGGVLEPIGALPVIVEDDVFIGGNSGIYDGTIVKQGAVIGAGVVLTGSTPVYDVISQKVYSKGGADVLVIPERAVVVPGTRPLASEWARAHQLSLSAPVIIKYRDAKTDASTSLEEMLR